MAKMTQTQMLESIIGSVDEMKVRQKTMEKKLDNIEIDLGGTERDPERGVIPRLHQVEKCVGTIKKKQYKIFVWAIAITATLNVLWMGIKFLVTFGKG